MRCTVAPWGARKYVILGLTPHRRPLGGARGSAPSLLFVLTFAVSLLGAWVSFWPSWAPLGPFFVSPWGGLGRLLGCSGRRNFDEGRRPKTSKSLGHHFFSLLEPAWEASWESLWPSRASLAARDARDGLLSCSVSLSGDHQESGGVLGLGATWGHLEAILGCLEASSGAHVDAVGGHPAELFTLRESPPAQPKTATLAKSTDYRDLLVIFSATMPRGPEELL